MFITMSHHKTHGGGELAQVLVNGVSQYRKEINIYAALKMSISLFDAAEGYVTLSDYDQDRDELIRINQKGA